jgi:uncharacterized protein YkwD
MPPTAEAPSGAGAFLSSVVRVALRGLLLATLQVHGAEAAPVTRGEPRADPARVAALVAQRTSTFRAANKLAPLQVNGTLADAAQRFAEYMASTEHYGHEADGRQPADRALAHGYEYCIVAENIAYQFSSRGFASAELAERLVEAWEQSPEHRRNMLLPGAVDIGVGIARSDRTQRYYAVQMFGRPKSAATQFAIANRSDAAIRYEVDQQAYTLPPRVTRTHQGCFSGSLKVVWPDGPPGPGLQPHDGARYTVERDESGQLRLQTN